MHDYDIKKREVVVIFKLLTQEEENKFFEWLKTYPEDKSHYDIKI